MKENKKETIETILAQYEAAESNPYFTDFCARARENEAFYLGKQWKSGEAAGLTKPVFNLIGRICDYKISTVCQKNYTVSYTLEGAPPAIKRDKKLAAAVEALDSHLKYRMDKEALERLLFSAVRDAMLYGSGVLYTYWDSETETGQSYKGSFKTVPLDPTSLFPADPTLADVQSQEYFLISGRELASRLREEAKLSGASEDDLAKIIPDEEEDGKCKYILKFEKIGGQVGFTKVASGVIIKQGSTGLSRYPFAVYSPTEKRNSFFGEPAVSAMIPNQQYVNRSYCMLMKHMQDAAFSKVIYDKTKIPEWDGKPGSVIAAHSGGGSLADAVSVISPGSLSDGYRELSDRVIEATKELYGATDVALGNVDPENTSAIIAAREAASGQLKGSIICLTSMLEEQARIWADAVITYYGRGRCIPLADGSWTSGVEFARIKQSLLTCRITVADLDRFGTSTTLSVLDKLLDCGAITPKQYIERLPDGILPEKEALISAT